MHVQCGRLDVLDEMYAGPGRTLWKMAGNVGYLPSSSTHVVTVCNVIGCAPLTTLGGLFRMLVEVWARCCDSWTVSDISGFTHVARCLRVANE